VRQISDERIEVAMNLEFHNAYLKEEVETALAFGAIVGRSRVMHQVLEQVEDVARTDATVLILGESGTGKELLANEIHHRGPRAQGNFVRVNCSAIPREVFESEFFGHVRGAFTGAVHDRPGRFQVADGGTIFLDEVGELPLDMQPKLLRVLQEGQYERVGEDMTRKVDVRVVAATNQDLQAEARARRFRQDLFYRLNVFPIELPPLRARKDDIPLLAAHFVAQASKKHGVPSLRLTKDDGERLQQYEWPGNIRELQNVIERAVILSKGERLRLDLALAGVPAAMASLGPSSCTDTGDPILTEREWRDRERANLLNALRRTEGRIYGPGGAAELLGLKPTTLTSRLRALKIDIPSH
jgi:transcriptional regulator with GAF, ATPase, and Fis domain